MRYIKKPIPVEAWHFTSEALDKPDSWVRTHRDHLTLVSQYGGKRIWLEVKTIEGMERAEEGYYIIKGVRGELYPCQEDIFLDTYEPYDELKENKGWFRRWKK